MVSHVHQVMVSSESSGVAFSRHPLKPISGNCVFIESVFGLGEGLVGGELEGDRFEVCKLYVCLFICQCWQQQYLLVNSYPCLFYR